MNESNEKTNNKTNLESLSTIQKILILQNLLKEMSSMKGIFNESQNKMIQKLDSNCYKYFKNKIFIKEIYDYFLAEKPEEQKKYELIENPKTFLDKVYQPLYDFFFLIRNDNSLMLKIIEFSDKTVYEDLSDFFVNFLYENILNNSFVENHLLLMIYLLLEKLILKNLPDNIDEKNKNIPFTYLKNTFLFYVFKFLTRKMDIRNFLCTILNDYILKIDSYRMALSVDISIVNRFLKSRERKLFHSLLKNIGSLKKEQVHKNKKTFKQINKNRRNSALFKKNTGNVFLKRANKIIIDLGESNNFDNQINDKLMQTNSLKEDVLSKTKLSEEIKIDEKNYKKFEKRNTGIKNENNENNDNKNNNNNENIESLNPDLSINKAKIGQKNNNEDMDDYNNDVTEEMKFKTVIGKKRKKEDNNNEKPKSEVDKFFEFNSITIEILKKKLSKYEKSTKNNINSVMKEYLNALINKVMKGEINELDNITKQSKKKKFENIEEEDDNDDENKIDDKEIFSTSLLIEELKSIEEIKQKESFLNLMYKIKFNYHILTGIINGIIKNIKDNLTSSPYNLKAISKIIDILLKKKYNSKSKNQLTNFQLYMFKINFLLGSIILPILKNPEFNGVISTNIISELTSENLKIVSSIFDKMINATLFIKKYDSYMTIFNRFIIETMPNLFELVDIIEKNFELSDSIKNLVNTSNNKDNLKRDINYDYFKENPDENIGYQDICFSWPHLYLLSQIISKYKKNIIDECENTQHQLILQKFLDHQDLYNKWFIEGIKNKKFEFLYFTKIFYPEKFNKKINSIIKDNFIKIIPKENNDLITAFKKCLAEMLNYVNKIQIENFYDLSAQKERKQNNNNILKKSLRKIDFLEQNEDADFRKILFSLIKNNVEFEMNYNIDNEISQRINFCTNYLNLYIRNIPQKYKDENYCLLFDELINETKMNMEYLRNNVIFEYYKKLKQAEKLNKIIANFTYKIKNLRRLKCVEILFNKLLLPNKFNIEKDPNDIVCSIEYEKEQNNDLNNMNDDGNVMDYLKRKKQPINNMIDNFQDFHEYEDEYDNILDIEEASKTPDAINDYFESIKKLIKNEKIIQIFNKEERDNIIYELQNYILAQMYDKLYPFESTKKDIFLYKKCERLGFIKPENIIKDKKIINEKLWEQSIKIFENLDEKLTPIDKIKCFGKAVEMLQNSIKFSSGKTDCGVDDLIQPLIYIMIKSKQKNIFTNYKYCELYLNKDLAKKQYGSILSQLNLIINIIERMKHNELIGVTEEEFGKDEIE